MRKFNFCEPTFHLFCLAVLVLIYSCSLLHDIAAYKSRPTEKHNFNDQQLTCEYRGEYPMDASYCNDDPFYYGYDVVDISPPDEDGKRCCPLLLSSLEHGVGGQIDYFNETTLLLRNLRYDGKAPDALIYVGKGPRVSKVSGSIIPVPWKGRHYRNNNDRSIKVLRRYDGHEEDILLPLPHPMKAYDVNWVSVYCRQYSIDFGNVFIPQNVRRNFWMGYSHVARS